MKLAAAALIVSLVGACSPDISGGTYYCGPERFCPRDLACDEPSFTCVLPTSARQFACPVGSNVTEPDDSLDDAQSLGTLRCGVASPLPGTAGCIDNASDVDLFKFEYDDECTGADPHLRVRLRYPIGLAAIEVEILDAAGLVVEAGEICTLVGDLTGTELVCLDGRLSSGTYYLRVSSPANTPNCGGGCHFNQFFIDVTVPLS